jgi:ribosomal protein S17
VHDPEEKAGVGDTVVIEEMRPLSKEKRWQLVSIKA